MIRAYLAKIYPGFTQITPAYSIIFVATLICLLSSGLSAKTWGTYTNTNNVTDVIISNNNIYTATWGGVVKYKILKSELNSPDDIELLKVITSVDGLTSNDIRTLAYESTTGDLWAGSAYDGITIIKPYSNQVAVVDTGSVLPSNNVRRILSYQSYVYVATDFGISQFYYLPGVYTPLLLHQYNEFVTQGGLSSNDVRDIAISPAGYLYCATINGISYVHTDSLDTDSAWHKWTTSNSPLPDYPILSLSVNADYLALNTMYSVHRRSANPNVSDWLSWDISTRGLTDSVLTVAVTPANNIMISYGHWDENSMSIIHRTGPNIGFIDSSGVLSGSPDTSARDDRSLLLPTNPVYRFLGSNNRTVYATWGQGVFINTDRTLHLEDNCIGFQTISDIKTDKNYNIWIGSGNIGAGMTKKGTRGVSKWSNGVWKTYNTKNSPLTIDNIKDIAIDSNNKKWFGSWDAPFEPNHWRPGVNVLDESTDTWLYYTRYGICTWDSTSGWSEPESGSPRTLNNTIADIYVDKDDNVLVSSSGAGIVAFDKAYHLLGNFQMPGYAGSFQSTNVIYHSGNRYFFGLYVDNKLVIWNNSSLPISAENNWLVPSPSDLNDCAVYGIVTIMNTFGEEENWIASSKGLYMWDGINWYRYDTDIKRRKLSAGTDTWTNDTLYYVDEERLFGAIREARPSCIFLDPFNRIWIGSQNNGFTMYDPVSERFTNYYQGKSPLISNRISCLGYDPIAGNLLIGTPEGLNTLQIGVEVKTEKHLDTVKAFPNPFFTSKDYAVRIVNLPSYSMPKGTNVCKIYDSSGAMVIELKESIFARFDWNGLNKKGQKCSSGIYFFVVSSSTGETKRGKIALIRED